MLLKIGRRPDHGFDAPLGMLSDCHRRIEHFLGTLVAIVREAGGGPLTSSQHTQLEAAMVYFATAAPRHTADEEESLFPRLRDCTEPGAASCLQLVERLQREHRTADENHHAVDALVRRWLIDGSLASPDADELCARLFGLQRMYESHIAAEDGILFPAAKRSLSAGQLRSIGREMAGRRQTRR
jgi:hemerythrin-like domain-containing protein